MLCVLTIMELKFKKQRGSEDGKIENQENIRIWR